jgi:hypothetical protein
LGGPLRHERCCGSEPTDHDRGGAFRCRQAKRSAVARYALVTVDAFPTDRINEDIEIGDYRAMDIRKPPFSRNSSIIAEYVNFSGHNFFVKHVHLLAGPPFNANQNHNESLIPTSRPKTRLRIRCAYCGPMRRTDSKRRGSGARTMVDTSNSTTSRASTRRSPSGSSKMHHGTSMSRKEA